MYNNDYGGGYVPPSSQGGQSPGGGERKASNQSLRPVTIKQALLAETLHSDQELYIDGVEVSHVTIVAQVINIVHQTTNQVFYLDDGTGKMEARKWAGDTPEDSEDLANNGIGEGTYVRVTGLLKAFNKKRYVTASSMRSCTDPHELYFHLQEVVYVTLVHQKGRIPTHQNGMSASPTVVPSTSNYSNYTSSTATVKVSNSDLIGVSPIGVQIMRFMETQPKIDEGIHVASITRAVGKDANAISNAIDELMERGLLFSTFDESHFATAT